MDTPRCGLGRFPCLLICLCLGLTARAATDPALSLEAQVGGAWLKVVGIEQKRLVGQGSAGPIAIADTAPLRLAGNLASHPELIDATTTFALRQILPTEDARPSRWRAEHIRPAAELVAGPEGRWRPVQPERAVLVCVWQVSGQPVQLRALPLVGGAGNSFTAPECTIELTAEDAPGNPVFVLFENAQPLALQVAAEQPAAAHLAALAALGQDELLAAEVSRLGQIPAPPKGAPSLLHLVAQADAIRSMNALLRLGAPVKAKTADEDTALHYAARAGRLRAVEGLIEAKAPLNAANASQNTPLHLAAAGAHSETCRALVEAGASLQSVNTYGVKPAFSALLADCAPAVDLILARKGDLGINDFIRDRVLVRKAAAGQRRLVRILLAQHADPNAAWLEQTPLLAAAREGHEGILSDLLAAKADPNRASATGATPLLAGASRGHAAVVRQLLAAGAQPSAAGKGGHTPLHAAAFAGSAETIRALLAAGVAVDPATDQGVTPLTFALGSGSREAVDTLLAAGAKVDAGSRRFESELAAALAMDADAFLAAALKAGMPVGYQTDKGWAALQLAQVAKAEKCVALLRAAGATEPDFAAAAALVPGSQLEKRPALLELHPTIDPRDPEEGDFESTTVLVDAVVGQDGLPVFARANCTDCRLSLSAVQTVLRSRFQPARKDGAPVATQVRIPIVFNERPERTFEAGALDMKPQPVAQTAPRYPFELKSRGITGGAVVQFVVAEDGSVRDIVVVTATHELFATAAVAAVRLWRFKPGVMDGKIVACRMQQAFPFQLR